MKVILTGITGNLGSEIFRALRRNGHQVIPLSRAENQEEAFKRLRGIFGKEASFPQIIISDLLKHESSVASKIADCIIHCAGIVRFGNAQNRNARMAGNISSLAGELGIPLYHISTAFVWRPDDSTVRNDYEKDKKEAEKIVVDSKVPWAIFRPSILTGNSINGRLLQRSSYHAVWGAFLRAVKNSLNRVIRFPRFVGQTNILPVNLAAEEIVDLVENNARGVHFITNPSPPSSEWFVSTNLKCLGLRQRFDFPDCSWGEYEELDLAGPERELSDYMKQFVPYWTGPQLFPGSRIRPVRIDTRYVEKIVGHAQSRNWIRLSDPL